MSVIENQEHLIAQTQQLYGDLLNAGKYAEAIAIGKLILDLSVAYKELGTVYPSIAKSSETGWIKSEPFGTAFGQTNFASISPISQRIKRISNHPSPEIMEELYKQKINNSQPYQPAQYAWADGFEGVTVPPRETEAPNLPNPNGISSQPRPDYWEDNRRQ